MMTMRRACPSWAAWYMYLVAFIVHLPIVIMAWQIGPLRLAAKAIATAPPPPPPHASVDRMMPHQTNRRCFLVVATASTTMTTTAAQQSLPLLSFLSPILAYPAMTVAVESTTTTTLSPSLTDLLPLLQQARNQLNDIPPLIESEKWDSVRAILLQPPLCDCWAKTARPLLLSYAQAIGDASLQSQGQDDNDNTKEWAALEWREELGSHLRFLDMAVYNNNFNPIQTQGTNGASPELVRSYYQDPQNEWKASVQALDALLQLAPK